MDDIATPRLAVVADVAVSVGKPVEVGETPHGLRRIVPILAGTVSGPRLNGRILPGGADYQHWHADGFSEVHARYLIETDAGALVYVENTGVRHGSAETMARLAQGLPVEPAAIYFRSVPRFETAAPELAWMGRALFLASGARYPDRVAIRFYEVL